MNGLIVQAKYSFMPNRIGGCGIQGRTNDIFGYVTENVQDKGLEELLETFEVAYPYIKFIAHENGIQNPFDARAVEAYWIGNELLDKVDKFKFYRWCHDRYKKQADPKILKLLVGKVPMGALPHHSFHVFNSYLRGHNFNPVIKYLNECRISSGKILKISDKQVEVETDEIILGLGGLEFSGPIKRKVLTKIKGKSFVPDLKVGDYVSIHWGWVCDKMTPQQVKNLKFYSQKQLAFFNDEASALSK